MAPSRDSAGRQAGRQYVVSSWYLGNLVPLIPVPVWDYLPRQVSDLHIKKA